MIARSSCLTTVTQHAWPAWQVHPNGEVGQALDTLQPGDKVALEGPFGKYVYKPGKFKAIGAALHHGSVSARS